MSSAPASGTTSAHPPRREHESAGEHAASKLSESKYLERQASEAQEAMARAWGELKRDLAKGADPRVWMQSHPWITLASAAVAGFTAAAVVVPSKEEQALRKLEKIERALHTAHHPESHANGNGSKKKSGGFLGMIIHELLGVLKPLLVTLVSAHANPQETGDNSTDGDPNAANAG